MNTLPENYYWLLDARAGAIAVQQNHPDISAHDWTRYIVVGGDANEVCKYLNDGSYGDNCVIANQQGVIMFEWCKDNPYKWEPDTTPEIEDSFIQRRFLQRF